MSIKAKTTTPKPEDKPRLTPKLRFPEFQDAGEWVEVPLSELVASLAARGETPSFRHPAVVAGQAWAGSREVRGDGK